MFVTNILKDFTNIWIMPTWELKEEESKCLYFDTCKEHSYPEFCKVFCTHDWYTYGVLKKHSKFVRKSTIAEDGTVCNDTILKLK